MKRRSKILVHVFFWIYIINQALFPYYMNKGIDKNYYLDIIAYVSLAVMTFYAVYLCVPFLLSLKNKILGLFLGIALLAALVPVRVGLEFLFWKYLVTTPESMLVDLSSGWWLNSLRLVIILSTYAFLIRLAIGWFDSQKLKSELLLQNQTSELALLRSQVNPHFLFNTLNNIYSLVYRKSEDAPAAVMKMSAIMRYMLFDAAADKVLLEKEIEYLKSFIELQQLRTRQKDFVSLTIRGGLEGRTIVPMLLIPFVENAFKHGNKGAPSPGIIISLTAEPGRIHFEISNYIKKNIEVSPDYVRGIGLNNVRRRLELLFPGKHTLETWEDQDMYHVKLILESV
jgi:two-component system LytT family sensor kinase